MNEKKRQAFRLTAVLAGLVLGFSGLLATSAAAEPTTPAEPTTATEPSTATEPTTEDNTPYIVGGGVVSQKKPWIAALHRDGGFTCTSTIIAKRWVLTAAHCVAAAGKYTVRVGSLDRTTGGTTAKVSKVVKHPKYNWPTADIALLQLDHDVNTTFAKLAGKSDLSDGKAVTVYGWGSEKADWSGPLPKKLKYANGTITKVSCTDSNANPRVICTKTNGSIAGGDSGGPAVVRNSSGQELQAGVCAIGHRPAGSGWAGYTSVVAFRDWIRSTAGV
ncbi:S1 family peptidase [Streptoalloteichus hindustanus]|uniref:Trypsin n=1 Tax=Streptoalloteichus hindustanus TaxID=2017 RepID=A0A1M5AY69_STRHI|nr:serine protease [Streptoalloteichus hindustanus]SHF35178.1 Trypsin [Streptoalloteichus hindustanus]